MFGYVPPVARRPIVWAFTGAVASERKGTRLPGRYLTTAAAAQERPSRRGLIIDLDDTLYPRERFVRSGLAAVAQHVRAQHGVAADAAYAVMTRAAAGLELQALCRRFGLAQDLVPGLVDVFRTHTPTLFLAEDVAETLRRLRADGWSLAILTNGLPSVQFRKVAALGLTALVDEVIYAEEHAIGGKPSAAPFEAALRSLELSPSQCICVGDDAARDVRGARGVGMTTIRVARPGTIVAAADEADAVIDSLRELPDAAALLMRMVTADVA